MKIIDFTFMYSSPLDDFKCKDISKFPPQWELYQPQIKCSTVHAGECSAEERRYKHQIIY